MESERSNLEKSRNTSTTEVETLKLSISEHEREKRDLIGVIDRLRVDDEQRDG
jgi:nucleoprotein TPR